MTALHLPRQSVRWAGVVLLAFSGLFLVPRAHSWWVTARASVHHRSTLSALARWNFVVTECHLLPSVARAARSRQSAAAVAATLRAGWAPSTTASFVDAGVLASLLKARDECEVPPIVDAWSQPILIGLASDGRSIAVISFGSDGLLSPQIPDHFAATTDAGDIVLVGGHIGFGPEGYTRP